MSDMLAGRYRRLLRVYPRDYRRRHELELLTTLMEAARPGQMRPDRADVTDLLRGGLRQRFRLPLGWTVRLLAVVACLAFAVAGAGAGSWLGWQAAASEPTRAEVLRTTTDASGVPYTGWVHRHDMSGIPVAQNELVTVESWDETSATGRLAADGWRITDTTVDRWVPPTDGRELRTTMLTGDRAGVQLRVVVTEAAVDGTPDVTVSLWPQRPVAVPVLMAVGAVLAALGAWLLVAWGARRLRAAEPAWRIMAGVICAVALAGLSIPAPRAVLTVVGAVVPDPHGPWPFPQAHTFYVGYEHYYLPAVALIALAAATAAVARPLRTPVPG